MRQQLSVSDVQLLDREQVHVLRRVQLPMSGRRRVERYDVVVIGGGQAGLATGYWLAQHDVDFVVLDANPRVGDAWRNRWDSLQLFTPARYNGLPGLSFPAAPYHLPGKDEVADYLEWYAQVFDLPVRNNVRVRSVRRGVRGYEILCDRSDFEADNVIVATGPFHTPSIPGLARDLDPSILQLHSSDYRNAAQLPEGEVLVVGAANSGAQIALDVSRTHNALLAGRSVGSLPRRILGRDLFDWLYATVMRPGTDSIIGRRMQRSTLSSTDKLIGFTERDLTTPTLRRVGRVAGARDGKPLLDDGRVADVRSIVWSTGFRPDFRWIELPVFDANGLPRHVRGVVQDQPGLSFVGLRFQHRLNSSLIGGVGADAEYVARAVLARYGETRTASFPASSGALRRAV